MAVSGIRSGAREDLLHDVGVAGHLLLIARGEGLRLKAGEERLNLAVAEARPLDARRGADALDGRDVPQPGEPFGSKGLPSAPLALEFVDLADQPEHVWEDRDGIGQEHAERMEQFWADS